MMIIDAVSAGAVKGRGIMALTGTATRCPNVRASFDPSSSCVTLPIVPATFANSVWGSSSCVPARPTKWSIHAAKRS